MPSMESDGDAMLWSTVAFLEKLPRMSDEAYNDLWMQAQAAGGQGGMDHGAMNMDGAGSAGQPADGRAAGPAGAGTGNAQTPPAGHSHQESGRRAIEPSGVRCAPDRGMALQRPGRVLRHALPAKRAETALAPTFNATIATTLPVAGAGSLPWTLSPPAALSSTL